MVDSDFAALQGSKLPGEVARTNDLNAAACRVTLSAGIDKMRLVGAQVLQRGAEALAAA